MNLGPKLLDLATRFTSRSTLFCLGIAVVGHVALWKGYLRSADYPFFCAVILSAVVGHAVQENWFNGKKKDEGDDHA